MKKMFTIDDFMVAFVSALGYGFGETISRLSGWPEILCQVASFALGMALEELISAIVFSKPVQKKRRYKVIVFACIILIFLAAQYISVKWMGVDMLEYLQDEFQDVIIDPILGFGISMLLRFYHLYRLRKRYGDGSEGYVFELKDKDIEETNKQNQPILGEYNC